MISNSLYIDFIHGDIHDQSCKKFCYLVDTGKGLLHQIKKIKASDKLTNCVF